MEKIRTPFSPSLRLWGSVMLVYWSTNSVRNTGIHNEQIVTARCYASAVLAMGLCLSVRHKSVFYRNGWTNRAGFWHVSFLLPVLHCVKRKYGYGYLQNKGTSLWNFVLNSGLRKFRHGISIVETCYQLSSRKVDAQSVINWAVVGQLSSR